MGENGTCYVVSRGEYSEWAIMAVFLDRAEAEAYRGELIRATQAERKSGRSWPDSINDVDEFPLGRPVATEAKS